ncbi:hypothetical protein RSAG8_06366, partial [Rhizoctonia solani AG-8 WAC10335]
MDCVIVKKVDMGILPPRPTALLGSDRRGNLVWKLLLKCWSRNVSERLSAGQVVGALVFHTE